MYGLKFHVAFEGSLENQLEALALAQPIHLGIPILNHI
jgi:hypothetical protein